MAKREFATRPDVKREREHEQVEKVATNSGAAATSEALKDELDNLLDEIDEVLEENADEFVKSYIQKGGE